MPECDQKMEFRNLMRDYDIKIERNRNMPASFCYYEKDLLEVPKFAYKRALLIWSE